MIYAASVATSSRAASLFRTLLDFGSTSCRAPGRCIAAARRCPRRYRGEPLSDSHSIRFGNGDSLAVAAVQCDSGAHLLAIVATDLGTSLCEDVSARYRRLFTALPGASRLSRRRTASRSIIKRKASGSGRLPIDSREAHAAEAPPFKREFEAARRYSGLPGAWL